MQCSSNFRVCRRRLALAPIHLHPFGHLIDTYITGLLVSFQLRLGLAVRIDKFRPKQPEKLCATFDSAGFISLGLGEVTGSILSGDFTLSF